MSKNLEKAFAEGKHLFLLYGQEKYMLDMSLTKIIDHFLKPEETDFNLEVIESLPKDIFEVLNKCNTLPFMAEYRVVVLKHTGLFDHKDKEALDKLAQEMENLPATTVLIVKEDTVDKRKKLYKLFQTQGCIEEQEYLNEEQMVQLLGKWFYRYGLRIKTSTVKLLLQRAGTELSTLRNECEKLVNYAEDVVTDEMVIALVSEQLESKIFQLTDALGRKDRQTAMENYQIMLRNRESVNGILHMIGRQIKLIYQTKLLLAERLPSSEIAKRLGVAPFVANKLSGQAKLFSARELDCLLKELITLEWDFKRGKVDPETGLELLLLRFGAEKDNKHIEKAVRS